MTIAAPKPKREPLPPITGEVVGEPTQLSSLARLLLPYLRQPALRLVAERPDEHEESIDDAR